MAKWQGNLNWSDFAYKSPKSNKIIFDADKTLKTLEKIGMLSGVGLTLFNDLT